MEQTVVVEAEGSKEAEEPKSEEPKDEEPKAEDPKAEEPKSEDPKTEDPKTEDPEDEEPKDEEPKNEEPKSEEPKAGDPKNEEPKNEEPQTEEMVSDAVQAFLDAVKAIVIPEGELTYEMAQTLNEQVGTAYDAYEALSEEEQALQDVVDAMAIAEKAANLLNGATALIPEENGATVAKVGDVNYETLQAAIDAAEPGATVTLTADVTENIKIKKSLTLDLNGHTIDGDHKDIVIDIKSGALGVTIKNGTIKNGNSPQNGGGIRATNTNATLILEKVTISDCYAKRYGGAIMTGSYVRLQLNSSRIINNKAGQAGGGIDVGNTTTLTDTAISGNTVEASDGTGGGVYITIGAANTFTIAGSTMISKNKATKGGGIYHHVGTVVMNGGEISDNEATTGGGIYSQSNSRDIYINSDGKITGNKANAGAGIYVQHKTFLTIDGEISGNTATGTGGGIYLNTNALGLQLTGYLCNNTAGNRGDDLYAETGKEIALISAGDMSQTLTTDQQQITGWFHDGYNANTTKSQRRWSQLNNYEEYTTLTTNPAAKLALKAAHGQTFTVTYDANGGTGAVTDSNKYAEGKSVTVKSGDALSRADNYFVGWNTSADGSGTSYKAGATFNMPARDVTLYAQWLQWKTSSTLPGDMYVDANDSTAIAERKQGQTVDVAGQIQVTDIQNQMNKISDAFGLGAATNAIPVTINEFQFTAEMTLPQGLTLPPNLTKESVNAQIGNFKVTEVKTSGQKVAVTFGADTSSILNFGQLEALVKNAADKGWISITVPAVKVDDDAARGYLTARGAVSGTFKATAGIKGVNSKEFDFTWNAKQDPSKKDQHDTGSEPQIQATVNVKAADPADVEHDPPVSKTISGDRPSASASFGFRLTRGDDSYPWPKNAAGHDVTEVTVTVNPADSLTASAEFGKITFTKPGTYTYTVEEIDGGLRGYTYDTSKYTVTYTVANNNGKLECSRTITKEGSTETNITTCSFTNPYSAPSDPAPTPTPGGGDDGGNGGTTSTTPLSITEFGNQIAEQIMEIFESGSAINEPIDITESGSVSETGDDSMMVWYGVVAALAAATLTIWTIRRKYTN